MATDHRRVNRELVQDVLLDDPGLLTRDHRASAAADLGGRDNRTHRGRSLRARRLPHLTSQRLQTKDVSHQGGHSQSAGVPGPGGDLLHEALLPLAREQQNPGVPLLAKRDEGAVR